MIVQGAGKQRLVGRCKGIREPGRGLECLYEEDQREVVTGLQVGQAAERLGTLGGLEHQWTSPQCMSRTAGATKSKASAKKSTTPPAP